MFRGFLIRFPTGSIFLYSCFGARSTNIPCGLLPPAGGVGDAQFGAWGCPSSLSMGPTKAKKTLEIAVKTHVFRDMGSQLDLPRVSQLPLGRVLSPFHWHILPFFLAGDIHFESHELKDVLSHCWVACFHFVEHQCIDGCFTYIYVHFLTDHFTSRPSSLRRHLPWGRNSRVTSRPCFEVCPRAQWYGDVRFSKDR
jgi:hypothetical protein